MRPYEKFLDELLGLIFSKDFDKKKLLQKLLVIPEPNAILK